MKIDIRTSEQGFDHVTLNGDLDFNTSTQVRSEFAKLTEKNLPKVLISMESVGYIDSSGLATFIELFQKFKRSGGKLVLSNLNANVRSVFEIAKLDKVFHLADSPEQISLLFA